MKFLLTTDFSGSNPNSLRSLVTLPLSTLWPSNMLKCKSVFLSRKIEQIEGQQLDRGAHVEVPTSFEIPTT